MKVTLDVSETPYPDTFQYGVLVRVKHDKYKHEHSFLVSAQSHKEAKQKAIDKLKEMDIHAYKEITKY